MKAERQMNEQQKDITMLNEEIKTLKLIAKINEKDLKEKCAIIQEKEEQINNINKHLAEIISDKENKQAELESKITEVMELKHKMNSAVHEDVQKALRSEEWVKAIGQRDTCKYKKNNTLETFFVTRRDITDATIVLIMTLNIIKCKLFYFTKTCIY